jgi:hypothetical protein
LHEESSSIPRLTSEICDEVSDFDSSVISVTSSRL